MKTCTACGETKPYGEFYTQPRMKDGHFNQCKRCNIAKTMASAAQAYRDDPERVRADRARWARNTRLRRYGLTAADYDQLYAEQEGKCAICGTADPGAGSLSLPVDHDHQTGAVRGLLCHGCNTGLGRFEDDPDRLLAAAAYLLARRDVLGVAF